MNVPVNLRNGTSPIPRHWSGPPRTGHCASLPTTNEGARGATTLMEAGMEHALDDLERQVASIDTKFLS